MNSGNSRTSDPNRLLLNLSDHINFKRSDKYFVLSSLSIYYTLKNIKTSCENNKFKISAPKWNKRFELPDGSYSVLDIKVYFEYIIKKHNTGTDNPPIRMSVNKIENRITLRIKTGYFVLFLTPQKIKLLESTKNKIIKMVKICLV